MAARISSRSGLYCACKSSNGTFIRLLYPLPPSRFALRQGKRVTKRATSAQPSAPRFHRRSCFAVGLAALDRLALVVILLALGQADRHFHAPVLEIQPDRYERH